jgi:hypothetical protein
MEPIPKLNLTGQSRIFSVLLVTVFIAVCVGLLYQRLAAIYVRPSALPKTAVKTPPPREDALLFEQALAAGLLRLQADGRIAVAPADLPLRRAYAGLHPDLVVPRAAECDWLDGVWDERVSRLHRVLHFNAAGRYVRRQVDVYNARQLLAAIRWRAVPGIEGVWQADWAGAPLTLTGTMPASLDRLLAEQTTDWQPWRRVARWPAWEGRSPVHFQLVWPQPASGGEQLELIVVGKMTLVSGGRLLESELRCLQDSSCTESEAIARWLRLELAAGATGLEVSVLPLPADTAPGFLPYGSGRIRREGERLIWRERQAALPEESGRRMWAVTSKD